MISICYRNSETLNYQQQIGLPQTASLNPESGRLNPFFTPLFFQLPRFCLPYALCALP